MSAGAWMLLAGLGITIAAAYYCCLKVAAAYIDAWSDAIKEYNSRESKT